MMPPNLGGSDKAEPVGSDTSLSSKVPAVKWYLVARVVGAHALEVLPVGAHLLEEVSSPPGRPFAWVSGPPPPQPLPPLVDPLADRTTAVPLRELSRPPSSVT